MFNISTLKHLDLSGNDFTKIPKKLLTQTSSLEVIKLTGVPPFSHGVPYEGNWTSDMLPRTLRGDTYMTSAHGGGGWVSGKAN